jgi:hypothetical protein
MGRVTFWAIFSQTFLLALNLDSTNKNIPIKFLKNIFGRPDELVLF